MQVFTLANEKGGVGKTTTAITMAAGLAVRGKTVLLVDADAQGHATWGLGLKQSPGFYDLMVRDAEWRQVLKLIPPENYAPPGMAGVELKGTLLVLPGNGETQLISQKIDEAFLLADRIEELAPHVDAVIFDTSPTPSLLHGAIYLATDWLIYPTLCETYSLNGLLATVKHREGFRQQRQTGRGKDTKMAGIIPTRYQGQTVEHSVNYEELRKKFGDLVWQPVANRIAWSEAATARQPVFAHAPESQASADAWEIVDRMMEVLNG